MGVLDIGCNAGFYIFELARRGAYVAGIDLASGCLKQATVFDCTCPDFRYRCEGVGIRCKHMAALQEATERGEVQTW